MVVHHGNVEINLGSDERRCAGHSLNYLMTLCGLSPLVMVADHTVEIAPRAGPWPGDSRMEALP
jgi:hypothetical protein